MGILFCLSPLVMTVLKRILRPCLHSSGKRIMPISNISHAFKEGNAIYFPSYCWSRLKEEFQNIYWEGRFASPRASALAARAHTGFAPMICLLFISWSSLSLTGKLSPSQAPGITRPSWSVPSGRIATGLVLGAGHQDRRGHSTTG